MAEHSYLPPCPPLPVALPGVPDVGVVDAVLVRLLVQEVEHVLDGEGQGAAAVHRAEQRLKQVVHELLQRALMGALQIRQRGMVFFLNAILFYLFVRLCPAWGELKFSLEKALFHRGFENFCVRPERLQSTKRRFPEPEDTEELNEH